MKSKQNEADVAAQQYLALERSLSSRSRIAHIIFLVLSIFLTVTFGLGLCLSEHEEFSPQENRLLATPKAMTLDTLLDGSLTRSLSDFCADQFPFRSSFVTVKAANELILGKRENNGVLLGKNGYLIARQEYTEENRADLEQNLRSVQKFSECMDRSGIPFTFAVVPRSIDVNVTVLPALYDPTNAFAVWSWFDQGCAQNGLTALTLTKPLRTLAEQNAAVWYKTDHHWTALGAYYAYASLGEALGYEPYPLSDFKAVTVCEDFYGTTYASSGMHWVAGEELTLARYENDDRLITEIITGDQTLTLQGLYDMSALDTHDEYNVFLGGTNAHIRVTDPSRPELPTLVILKDSFSQSLAPYLARHFQLVLIDPRTFKADPSSSLYLEVCKNDPDRVLLLCGIATLCEPSSLRNLAMGLDR